MQVRLEGCKVLPVVVGGVMGAWAVLQEGMDEGGGSLFVVRGAVEGNVRLCVTPGMLWGYSDI